MGLKINHGKFSYKLNPKSFLALLFFSLFLFSCGGSGNKVEEAGGSGEPPVLPFPGQWIILKTTCSERPEIELEKFESDILVSKFLQFLSQEQKAKLDVFLENHSYEFTRKTIVSYGLHQRNTLYEKGMVPYFVSFHVSDSGMKLVFNLGNKKEKISNDKGHIYHAFDKLVELYPENVSYQLKGNVIQFQNSEVTFSLKEDGLLHFYFKEDQSQNAYGDLFNPCSGGPLEMTFVRGTYNYHSNDVSLNDKLSSSPGVVLEGYPEKTKFFKANYLSEAFGYRFERAKQVFKKKIEEGSLQSFNLRKQKYEERKKLIEQMREEGKDPIEIQTAKYKLQFELDQIERKYAPDLEKLSYEERKMTYLLDLELDSFSGSLVSVGPLDYKNWLQPLSQEMQDFYRAFLDTRKRNLIHDTDKGYSFCLKSDLPHDGNPLEGRMYFEAVKFPGSLKPHIQYVVKDPKGNKMSAGLGDFFLDKELTHEFLERNKTRILEETTKREHTENKEGLFYYDMKKVRSLFGIAE